MQSNPRARASSRRLATLFIATAATAASMSSDLHGQTVATWTGTTGNYVAGINWSSGTAPTVVGDTFAAINNGGTALVNTGDSAEAADLVLGLAPTESGQLTISDGTLTLGDLHVGGRALLFDNATPNAGGTGTLTQSGGTVNVTATGAPSATPKQWLYIGDGGLTAGNSATGSYALTGGQLNVGTATSGRIHIGVGPGSVGSFAQSGSSTVVINGDSTSGSGIGTMQVGVGGGTGSYSLSGTGSFTATNGVNVGAGPASVGSVNHSGGTFTDKTDMNVGLGGGTGSYTISGGTLAIGALSSHVFAIGNGPGSVGTFTQKPGSTVTVTGRISVGRDGSVSDNLYKMEGGTLSVSTEINVGGWGNLVDGVAQSAKGTFVQTAGDVVAKTNLVVGFATLGAPNLGTYTMDSGTITLGSSATSGILAVGNGSGAAGSTFTQNNGSIDAAILSVGRGNGGDGSYTLNNGTIALRNDSNNNSLIVGGSGATGTRGTLTQTGGTITTTGNIYFGWGVANTGDSTGTYNLSGGSLTLNRAGGIFSLGHNAGNSGTLVQTGGSITVTGATSTFDVGRSGNLSHGSYTLSGTGVLNTRFLRINGNTASQILFSGGTSAISGQLNVGAGTMTITGGTHTFDGSIFTSSGLLAISGGTINWPTGANVLSLGSNSTLRTSIPLTIPSPITLGEATVDVESGAVSFTGGVTSTAARILKKTGPGTLTISGSQTHVAGSAYTNNGGTLNLDNAGHTNLTVNANAGATNFRASQTLAALTVADGVTATLTADGARTLTLGADPNLSTTGTLDLTNNSLVISTTGILGLLVPKLQQAFNNGAWDGTGLTSTTARDRADNATGLGYREDAAQTLVKYTWAGDLDLSGSIDPDDYVRIDRHVALGGLGAAGYWADGDVNYDGIVNAGDYLVMDVSFTHQTGSLSPELLAQRQAQFGSEYVSQLIAAVPEPTSLGLVAAAALGLTGRRSRRRHA